MHVSGYIGTFMVLIGLLVTIIGFARHRSVLLKVEPPPPGTPAPSRAAHVAAAMSCALVCVLLAHISRPTLPRAADLTGVERNVQLTERPAETVTPAQRPALVAPQVGDPL